MATDVVVPFRSDDPARSAAWAFIEARYKTVHPKWPITVGAPAAGAWCKAAAVADALDRSGGDVLVVADADVWCDNLGDAVQAVEAGAPWAIPHLLVHRLDEASTTAVLAGGPLNGTCIQRPYRGHAGGGIVVITRSLYRQIPLDPRFTGWGQEDDSWALALECLAGRPWRGTAPLWHLHHPPQARLNRRVGSQEGAALHGRYGRARTRPDAMQRLLEEAR